MSCWRWGGPRTPHSQSLAVHSGGRVAWHTRRPDGPGNPAAGDDQAKERGAPVASSRDRQRKLARAKLDRQLARRAAATRRRRQIQAGVGAFLVLAVIVAGSAWALGAFDSDPKKNTAAEDTCLWTPQDASANTNLKDVGTPATKGLPTDGTRAMTVTTNQGAPITAELNLANSPAPRRASPTWRAGRSTTTPRATRSPPTARCAAVTPAAPASAGRPTRSTTRTCRPCRRRRRRPARRPVSRRRTPRAPWR